MFRQTLLATAASASMVVGIFAAGAVASDAMAKPVSLSDASYPPTVLHYIQPGKGWTPRHDREGRTCGLRSHRRGYFSDVSAYRWTGRALHAQRWNRDHTETFWIDHDDFAVTYDGLTFFNDTPAPVLVAGWCE